MFLGLTTGVIFFALSGFRVEFSWFSLLMALGMSSCAAAYTILGFAVMKAGNMAVYTLFLMSGGMILPALWGWLFLDEPVLILRLIGVVVIVVSISLTHSEERKINASMLLSLCCVFFLNGMVSVLSKLHQVNTVYETVSTTAYALLSTVTSLVISIAVYAFRQRKPFESKQPKKSKNTLTLILIVALYSLTGSVSSLLQLEGAKNLPASVLYPMITGGSIVLTGIMALIFFGEKLSRREWTAILLCLGGTFMFL
jgi:drug/metabolite transporter (DMT)-like permease